MADEIKSNLEPIEESDLNLKEKFTGGGEAPVEAQKENTPTPEAIPEKQERAVEKEAAYSKILSKVPAQNQKIHPDDVTTDAATANTGIDAESKISNLIKIAETKGIPHAVKVARHMEDNYMLDEFHDRMLGEELHSALVAKGMIKEI